MQNVKQIRYKTTISDFFLTSVVMLLQIQTVALSVVSTELFYWGGGVAVHGERFSQLCWMFDEIYVEKLLL